LQNLSRSMHTDSRFFRK